jgi:hypothetical protein
MLVTETRTINDKQFTYNYSDSGFYIERDGILYAEAYDPIDSGRVYTETDTPIEPTEDTEAAYAEAGKILMGVK